MHPLKQYVHNVNKTKKFKWKWNEKGDMEDMKEMEWRLSRLRMELFSEVLIRERY